MASKNDNAQKPAKPMRLPRSPFLSPARKVGDLALKPLADALGERGFAGPEVISQWESIVGAELAAVTAPDRIQWPRHDPLVQSRADGRDYGATLHLRAQGPGAIEVQHMADLILERVNQFFGFQAVTRLRIVQAPVLAPAAEQTSKNRQRRNSADAEPLRIEGIANTGLETALGRLGAALRGRKS